MSVSPRSRTLAKVDLLNASHQADMVELALDQLINPPDVKEIIEGAPKPVVVSCRTPAEGGHYTGSEDDRNILLRQAVLAKPEYVELSLETARVIPPFGGVKRVVSVYVEPNRKFDPDELFQAAKDARGDVLKIVTAADSLEAGWPLLKLMFGETPLPVVSLVEGPASVMLALLGRRFGSPWTYAALEPEMRLYPEQPTIFELDDVYRWRRIDNKTRFVGILGTNDEHRPVAEAISNGFESLQRNLGVMPVVEAGSSSLPKMLSAIQCPALFATPAGSPAAARVAGVGGDDEEMLPDLVLWQNGGWQGHQILWRGLVRCVDALFGDDANEGKANLGKKQTLILGSGPIAEAAAFALTRRRANVSITAKDGAAAEAIGKRYGLRIVPYATLYDTLTDVVVTADPTMVPGFKRSELNPSFFRPGATVIDAARLPQDGPLAEEASERGCRVVSGHTILGHVLVALVKSVTGQVLSVDAFVSSSDE